MPEKNPKTYWKSLSQPCGAAPSPPVAGDEFPESHEPARQEVRRRDFLAAAGFALGGVALGGCRRTPVEKAIPYLVQPEAIVPGRAVHYASTCGACSAGCGLLVKNRDGRAIKLEGNDLHPVSRGGVCAVGQASILGLYDNRRLRHPLRGGEPATWDEVDADISPLLDAIRTGGGSVRFLSGPITSPTKRRVIQTFLGRFDDGKHVSYETLSTAAIHQAHERTHGRRALPRYLFEEADVIVGFDADFLGTWIAPVAFTAGWSDRRKVEQAADDFSYHAQFEGRVSVTGTKADRRIRIAPSELGAVVNHLASTLAARAGVSFDSGQQTPLPIDEHVLEEVSAHLWRSRGKSLVVCGSQDVDVQVLCNFINETLGNYGRTLDISQPAATGGDGDGAVQSLMQELASGRVDALFLDNFNPVYDLPNGAAFATAMGKVGLIVSFADRLTETSEQARYVCPDHHYLESWGDVSLGNAVVGFRQPVMRPLFDTRSCLESLTRWSGTTTTAQDLVRQTWGDRVSWDRAIHDGFASVSEEPARATTFRADAVSAVPTPDELSADAFALVLYPKVAMLDGRVASNPWLHEMPDPVTKVVWDNYASLSPAAAQRLGVTDGDLVSVRHSPEGGTATSIELPALVQPGQHDRVVAIALGYGHAQSARFADVGPEWLEKKPTLGPNGLVGMRAAGLLTYQKGTLQLSGASVTVSPTGGKHELASTQDYHNIEVPAALVIPGMDRRRPMIRETTLASYKRDGSLPVLGHGTHHEDLGDLWPDDHKYEGHHWGMVVDLAACTGCSACVVSCQIENNIPVVGRDEVRRKRIMHWLRVDRYYSETDGEVDISHQPVMCQHCDHAPCETVCPVLATVHGEEGLNQQAYNRCVGTRYCANNCPYKTRRFNWFEYAREDKLANMALNPDITVRTRGVMEKCSFCVQRIEEARIAAKRLGRPIADGDVRPACQQSCPAGAIVFGDMNDPKSAVSKLIRSGRHYRMLEETNVKPSVGYLGLVRNRKEDEDHQHHG